MSTFSSTQVITLSSSACGHNKPSGSSKPFIQPKFTINHPNDAYEQEADAMADKIMRMPDSESGNNLFFKPAISSIQRKCSHCGEEKEQQVQRKNDEEYPTETPPVTTDPVPSLPGNAQPDQTIPEQPECSPVPFAREEFLKKPGASTEIFGFTKLETEQVIYPEIKLTQTGSGYVLEKTVASLPQIPSYYTGQGNFIEKEIIVVGDNACQKGDQRYPVKWVISRPGAEYINAGEEEHCADFKYAFDISLAKYRDAINEYANSGKIFSSQSSCKEELKIKTGVDPDQWRNVFICLAEKTKIRDKNEWHSPVPTNIAPDQMSYEDPDRCKFFVSRIYHTSLPEVKKHPSSEVIKDCIEIKGND